VDFGLQAGDCVCPKCWTAAANTTAAAAAAAATADVVEDTLCSPGGHNIAAVLEARFGRLGVLGGKRNCIAYIWNCLVNANDGVGVVNGFYEGLVPLGRFF